MLSLKPGLTIDPYDRSVRWCRADGTFDVLPLVLTELRSVPTLEGRAPGPMVATLTTIGPVDATGYSRRNDEACLSG